MKCEECADDVESNPTGLRIHCAEDKISEAKATISEIRNALGLTDENEKE